MSTSLQDLQLKEICQLTGVYWAIWLEYSKDWCVLAQYKVNLKQRNQLLKFVMQTPVSTWLFPGDEGKGGSTYKLSKGTGFFGKRIFIFPDQVTQRVVLVGADEISAAAQRFWKKVALGNAGRTFLDQPSASDPLNIELVPYHLPQALDRILEIFLKTGFGNGGWLAIRSGDYLEIKAFSNCNDCHDVRLPIDSNPLLRKLIQSRQACIVKKNEADWAMTPRYGFLPNTHVWNALPLVIGRRIIGLVSLWGEKPFQPDEWDRLKQLSLRIAPSVEASVTFADLSDHLRRLALLNDFAVTISSSLDLDQIIQRTFALLRRAFTTDRINLMILSSDESDVQNYFDRDGLVIAHTLPSEQIPWLLDLGDVYHVDLISPESSYKPNYPGSKSALVIPLRFRKQVIGVLGLENMKEGAFTVYDEHLLVVIASYLAGLVENGRLRREAEARARNLTLIHEVVEQVIGLKDVLQVAQIAAELMARNFDYELAGVALIMGSKKELKLAGIGGNAADLVQNSLTYMNSTRKDGIVNWVVNTGQSSLVNNVAKDNVYLPIPDWDAGSEMCVPLKDGNLVLGAIDVESRRRNAFSQNDLLVLESLAGILASVISNVGQYQELQVTVDQLRATRTELQDRIKSQHIAESRLMQAAKLAAVGEMAAGVAHELNNPLTTVSGFTELVLEEVPKTSPLYADLELVLHESHRARDVVRRLLDFSRQSDSSRSQTNVNEMVTDVLALVNHLLHTSGVQLYTLLSDGLPLISVDRNQLKQVILNLIHNALHAMPEGGKLQVASAQRKRDHHDWVTITVSDNGMGISPENLQRIFEPFFTTRAKDGGTGLGLSVSYGIVAGHGGFIEAESQVGKGSVFTIWLPVEAAQ